MQPSQATLESTPRSRLSELVARLKPLSQELAEFHDLVEQLQAECDQLRQQVKQLQAEKEELRIERSLLLHAWADEVFPEEELDRRSQGPAGSSLADIWKRLGNT